MSHEGQVTDVNGVSLYVRTAERALHYCCGTAGPPRMRGTAPGLPPVRVPTLGIWSTNDHYLDGERMKMSGQFVKARWRFEQIDGASHWIPLDAPDRLNQFLIEWLG